MAANISPATPATDGYSTERSMPSASIALRRSAGWYAAGGTSSHVRGSCVRSAISAAAEPEPSSGTLRPSISQQSAPPASRTMCGIRSPQRFFDSRSVHRCGGSMTWSSVLIIPLGGSIYLSAFIEAVKLHRVFVQEQRQLALRHALDRAIQNLARIRISRRAVRKIRLPHYVVDAEPVPDVETLARALIPEIGVKVPGDLFARADLDAVVPEFEPLPRVIACVEHVVEPSERRFGAYPVELRIAFEEAGEHQVRNELGERAVGGRRRDCEQFVASKFFPDRERRFESAVRVPMDRDSIVLARGPQRLPIRVAEVPEVVPHCGIDRRILFEELVVPYAAGFCEHDETAEALARAALDLAHGAFDTAEIGQNCERHVTVAGRAPFPDRVVVGLHAREFQFGIALNECGSEYGVIAKQNFTVDAVLVEHLEARDRIVSGGWRILPSLRHEAAVDVAHERGTVRDATRIDHPAVDEPSLARPVVPLERFP